MSFLNSILPTKQAENVFPKSGWAIFPALSSGSFEFLQLIVKQQSNGKKISEEDIKNIYLNKVCRGAFNPRNVRPWLLRTIGSLVLHGYLSVTSKINQQIIIELRKIRDENVFLRRPTNDR